MADDESRQVGSTRREYVRFSGALAAAGVLAGCAGGDDDGSTQGEPSTATDTRTATGTQTSGMGTTTDEPDGSQTPAGESAAYSVSLAPMGEVTFDAVPETAYAYSPHYADMAIAFGHGDAIASLGSPDAYAASMNYYYDAVDGASIDSEDLRAVWDGGVDKELFYDLDADVHLQDPCWLTSFAENWGHEDVEEIRENVGPWFGNRYSREYTRPPERCREGYRYYTLWELAEKVARVFRETRRFEAFQSEYEELFATIRSSLPPESERPTVGLVTFSEGTFRPYKLNNPGFAKAHLRPCGARDAFADSGRTYDENEDGRLDYEGMLAADPDVILHSQGISGFFDVADIREMLEDHPVGSELTAVRNDRVYSSGTPFQGPLMNLFQLEMTAKQLYPDIFGEWPADGSEVSYPDVPSDEQLFDRQRIANVIDGEL